MLKIFGLLFLIIISAAVFGADVTITIFSFLFGLTFIIYLLTLITRHHKYSSQKNETENKSPENLINMIGSDFLEYLYENEEKLGDKKLKDILYPEKKERG
jgi:phosphoglycerol transferase MdoB-like AlkP superfamily enzyme